MSMSSAPRPAQFGLWPSENKKEKSVANPRNKDLISEDDEEEEVVVLGYESSASDDETEPELDEAAKEEAAKKAAAEKAKEKPMRAALVQLVSKYDKKAGTNKTYKMSSTRDPTSGDDGKKDKYAHYALSTTLVFNANGRLTRKILEIKAPVLKDVCQTVIGNKFPGMNFKTPRVGINCPPRALFFYRHEFAEQKRLWEKRLEELKVLEDAKSEAEKAADREKAAAEAEAQRVADDAEKAAAAEFDDTDKNGKKKANAAARKSKTLEEKTYAELADDIEYLRLFLRFIQNELRDEIGIYESLTPQGLISYDTLWTIFPPDTLFLTHTHNSEPCLLRLGKGVTVTEGTDLGFFLDAFAVDYDGFNFGYVQASAVIPPFEGTMEIANLPAIPLAFLPDAEKVLADLTARGRLSEKLQAGAGAGRPSYMGYKGAALGPVVDRRRVQYTIAGRVMVDPTTFFRKNPERAINVRSLTSRKAAHAFEMLGYETTCTCSSCRESDAFEDGVDGLKVDADLAVTNHDPEERTHRTGQFYRPLTEPEAALVTPFVRGFALAEKKWCEFAVSKLTEVAWVTDAFDKLVLPAAQKELILAMVEATPPGTSSTPPPPLLNPPTPTSETPLEFPRDSAEESGYTFDDFIPAKGLGLVAVFAGPPGLGKTAATEAVAEYTRRPLYAVTTGELGESAAELEEKLAEILDIASTWNAILLIDEADIFLEARDAAASSIARNAMVGIFLRLLEYFRGTMFLTTNRVSAFDAAFKSRIHLSLRFGPLARDARAQVWRNFVGAVPGELVAPELLGRDEQGLQGVERLADAYPGTNGRNIKNAVKTGLRIARRRGGKLDERVLRDVLALGEAFDEEWRANASGL